MNRSIMANQLFGIILAGALALSCSRQIPDPVSPPKNDFVPPTPVALTAAISDRMAYLTWSVPDTGGIRFYRVYKADSTASEFELLAEPQTNYYAAANLRNGALYYFKVSSVSYSRFEGYSSTAISVVPNLYGIIVNSGDSYTNGRNVSLSLVAPAGTRFMQISSDSSFADAPWENFALTKPWQLTNGDGTKIVYARFRNEADQITADYYSDLITLDTEVTVDSVVYSPSGIPLVAGDLLHFKLFAGEPDGVAGIRVGQGLIQLELYDDGTRGDINASDGIYEVDYTVAADLDFENAAVYGDFTDRADNIAQQARSQYNLSVRRHPDQVSIYSINNPSGYFDRLELNWTRSSASDFAQYRVYRSTTAGVDSSDILARTISNVQTTTLTDTGLAQNATYYYKTYVLDNTGLWTGSNEVSASTNPNNPPDAVILYPIVAMPGTYDRLSLTWSASQDQDFLRYEVYRSYDSSVTTQDMLIFTSSSATSCVDSNLAADSTYYYAILTLDRGGNFSWSNMVSGHTGIDQPPQPAVLHPVNTQPDDYQNIRLEWSQPVTSDFQAYRLYSWANDNGRADSVLVALIFNQDSSLVIDHPSFTGSQDTLNYWYIVHTYDRGGNSASSNAERAHLVDDVPGQVNGIVVPEVNYLSISWTRSDIPDFRNYRLMRDTTSNPLNAVAIYITSNQETLTYSDRSTTEGQTYYYWLEIYDRRGHSSSSFLGSSQW